MKLLILLLCMLIFILPGCATTSVDPRSARIDEASTAYFKIANLIQLGESKENVLSMLLPTQQNLVSYETKSPDKYLADGDTIEIYYMRSGRQPDGLTTDDEFTPYIFKNNILVAIGWATLGGPITHGQKSGQVGADVQQQIQQHQQEKQMLQDGAGGCTPNFSTGGCL